MYCHREVLYWGGGGFHEDPLANNSRKTRINNSIYLLISKVNEKTGLGHFNFNPKLNTIFFNHKASVKGQDSITIEQVEHFVDMAVEECDRFFPVFYVFFNKKKSPKNAIDIARQDHETEVQNQIFMKKNYVEKLSKLFSHVDADDSGTINHDNPHQHFRNSCIVENIWAPTEQFCDGRANERTTN